MDINTGDFEEYPGSYLANDVYSEISFGASNGKHVANMVSQGSVFSCLLDGNSFDYTITKISLTSNAIDIIPVHRLFLFWAKYRSYLSNLLLKCHLVAVPSLLNEIVLRSTKQKKTLPWKRYVPSLESVLKVGLVVSICLVFPSKARACLAKENELDPNLAKQKRKLLLRVLVVGIGVVAVTTVSYALLYSPKVKLSDRLLSASKFVGLSSSVVDKIPEFLTIPDFLALPVSSDIAAELSKTLTFVRKTQFDKSYSDPRNKFLSEELLKVIFGRVDGLLSYRNSPDFNPVAMRSIESSVFIMCRKHQYIKEVCAELRMNRVLLKLAVSLYNHQNRTKVL